MALLLRSPVLAYGTLSAVVVAVTAALPGYPEYSADGVGSLGGAIFSSVLLVVGIAARWRPVWFLAVFLALFGVIVIGTTGVVERDPKALIVALLSAGLVRILLSREIDERLWHRSGAPA